MSKDKVGKVLGTLKMLTQTLLDKKKIQKGIDLTTKGTDLAAKGAKIVSHGLEKASSSMRKIGDKIKD